MNKLERRWRWLAHTMRKEVDNWIKCFGQQEEKERTENQEKLGGRLSKQN